MPDGGDGGGTVAEFSRKSATALTSWRSGIGHGAEEEVSLDFAISMAAVDNFLTPRNWKKWSRPS